MTNKEAKEELIRLFGAECFINKLKLRTDKQEYTGSQLKYMRKYKNQLQRLTYHHIVEKCRGGKATVENGALLTEENHRWFNQQTKEVQAELNKRFQEYKKCRLELVEDIETGIDINIAELVYTGETIEIKKRKTEKYNRAKVKRETRKAKEEFER